MTQARYKIIWVASMPRSGSMWIYNVTKEIFQKAGLEVLPSDIPKEQNTTMQLSQDAIEDQDPNRIWLLKTHLQINTDIDNTLIISVIRDIRDAMMSWMRFMHADFDTALNNAKVMAETARYYKMQFTDRILLIDYEDIEHQPFSVIKIIANRLSLGINKQEIEHIISKYCKSNVDKLLYDMKHRMVGRIKNKEEISRDDVLLNLDGTGRFIDHCTGFQTGHISNYKKGDWKNILTPEQISEMNEILGEWISDVETVN